MLVQEAILVVHFAWKATFLYLREVHLLPVGFVGVRWLNQRGQGRVGRGSHESNQGARHDVEPVASKHLQEKLLGQPEPLGYLFIFRFLW